MEADRYAHIGALTIVIPFYNEAPCIPPLIEALDQFMTVAPSKTRVLFVDDGSTDRGLVHIQAACQHRPHFGYLKLTANQGLSFALKAGIDTTTTPWVAYMDADLQTSPMDFLRLLPHCGPYDLVTGVREERKDRIVKRISSRLANAFRHALLKDGMTDTCCPLKVGRTLRLKSIPFFRGAHRFLPALVQMMGGRVYQTTVTHSPRIAGKAKYHLHNRLVGPFLGLLVVAWLQRHCVHYQAQGPYYE